MKARSGGRGRLLRMGPTSGAFDSRIAAWLSPSRGMLIDWPVNLQPGLSGNQLPIADVKQPRNPISCVGKACHAGQARIQLWTVKRAERAKSGCGSLRPRDRVSFKRSPEIGTCPETVVPPLIGGTRFHLDKRAIISRLHHDASWVIADRQGRVRLRWLAERDRKLLWIADVVC